MQQRLPSLLRSLAERKQQQQPMTSGTNKRVPHVHQRQAGNGKQQESKKIWAQVENRETVCAITPCAAVWHLAERVHPRVVVLVSKLVNARAAVMPVLVVVGATLLFLFPVGLKLTEQAAIVLQVIIALFACHLGVLNLGAAAVPHLVVAVVGVVVVRRGNLDTNVVLKEVVAPACCLVKVVLGCDVTRVVRRVRKVVVLRSASKNAAQGWGRVGGLLAVLLGDFAKLVKLPGATARALVVEEVDELLVEDVGDKHRATTPVELGLVHGGLVVLKLVQRVGSTAGMDAVKHRLVQHVRGIGLAVGIANIVRSVNRVGNLGQTRRALSVDGIETSIKAGDG
eukprot:m.477045 g.477045  ORF g.477045 m.477045 type:complete len:340 (-) comp20735_c0_seq1:601-1620(-)